jgi:glycosyltransferase involved in cell wall biosynthesis
MPSRHLPVILHVVNSLEGGGTERMLISLLGGFDPRRRKHVVVTLRDAGSLAARLPGHVACRPLGADGRSWMTGMRLARVARQWHAAVIHARNTGCWFDATVASILTPKARLVLGFHGLDCGRTFSRRRRRLARWGLRAGAWFTSVSVAGSRQLREQIGIPAWRIAVLENGVDLRPFAELRAQTRGETRQQFQFDDSAFVVGVVGSLTPVKRHNSLISAVARLVSCVPAIRLLVVGDGPLRSVLAAQAKDEGIADRVFFAGWRDDVPEMLAGMDAYVCSSESEGMNNALLEAMASGLPIVATDVGDNGVVLRDRTEGLLVRPGSVDELVNMLKLLADSADLRRKLAAAARERVASYDLARSVRAYELYYQTLLDASRDRSITGWEQSGTPALVSSGIPLNSSHPVDDSELADV